jgi:hypothetical protein
MSRSGSNTRSFLHRAAGGTLLALSLSMAALLPLSAAAAPLHKRHVHALADLHTEVVPGDLQAAHASPDVRELADWAVRSQDARGLPFVIVDKKNSRVFVFEADGQLRGATPALVGLTRGDQAPADIGTRPIADIQPKERITPAGRFKAMMGRGPKGEDILWVDYDSALALHRVVTNVPAERRLQRLASKVAAERRITYGCINVPAAFFDQVVQPMFNGSRGIVYILPELRPAGQLFGFHEVQHQLSQAEGMIPVSAH